MRIYRARRADQPKLPKSSLELLNMPAEYKKLDSGEDFLLAAEDVGENEALLVYMSSFGERVLSKSSTWLADGTFKCVPDLSKHMYVVFGAKQDSHVIFPACYCLLSKKKET